MGIDNDEYYSMVHTDRPGKKPSLHSRLQNGKFTILHIMFTFSGTKGNFFHCSTYFYLLLIKYHGVIIVIVGYNFCFYGCGNII